MTTFSDLGLAEPLLKALATQGYETPTPIQTKAIPALLEGKDIVGIAQTGTGKTAAFVLPSLDKILQAEGRPERKTARILIVAPTRELAAQIHESVKNYGADMRVSSAVVVGGVKPGKQIRAIESGLDVLVATPGRLLDHVDSGVLSLKTTHTIILDEADHMLDMGFIPAIRKIMKHLPKDRQTMLLSATMPPAIRSLANDFLRDAQEIKVTPDSKPVERIDQSVLLIEKGDKLEQLIQDLSAPGVESAIVFSRTKHGADKITKALVKANLPAAAIHGNKSQNQRTKALEAFKRCDVLALVATDIAARGIDIDGVSHVVNYDLPNIAESYVHRIGRTARAGKSGVAISYCSGAERLDLVEIEKLIGFKLDKFKHGADGEVEEVEHMQITAEHKAATKEANKQTSGRNRGGRGGGGRRGGSQRSSNRSGGGGGNRKRPGNRNRGSKAKV